MKMMLKLSYILLFIIASSKTAGQLIDETEFTYYGPKDGLSNNYVSGLEQDAAGFMWIATHNGLNRFDGKTFKHFFYNDKYNPIPDNGIYSMRLVQNDQLAIATDDGAQIISTKTLEQKNLSIDTDDKLRYWSNACRSVISDADGNYGISTKTGFYIFSSAGQLKNRYDFFTNKDIGVEWMLFGDDMYPLPDGSMMQLNKNGVLLYDRKTNQFADATIKYPALKDLVKEKNNSLFFFVSKYELVHINVETNCFDLVDIRFGKIGSFSSCIDFLANLSWMTAPMKINDSAWAVNCRTKGFFLLTLNLKTKKISCSAQKYFTDKLCTVFFVDRHNKLWIGTTEGFLKQNSHPKIVDSFALPNPTNKPVNITALFVGNEKIFAGTADDKIFVLDKKNRNLLHHFQIPEVSNNVMSFYLYRPDTLWIGTGSGLWWLNLQNYSIGKIIIDPELKSNTVILFFGDRKGNIWVVVNATNTVCFFDRVTHTFKLINNKTYPLFKTNISSIAEDHEGHIWMAGDAIIRWNNLTHNIDTLIEHLPGQRNTKKGFHVMADSKRDIWTTVPDDGLVNLTKSLHLRPKNLLLEKGAFVTPAILNDKILLATAKGPGYFDIISSKGVLFTIDDGVPDGIITSYRFIGDPSDGSVWFSCKNIICKLPLRPSAKQMAGPDLHLTALSILNDTLINYPSQKIHLNHKQGDINILYSAVNYVDPKNMRFSYRIKNKKDSSWIDAGDQQNILLTNISPGSYNLELKVSAFDNKWAEQIKELEITIEPPFWQTSLFIISMALIFAALVFYLYRYRIKHIKQKANLDKQLAQTEMKALHSQMNPHFIFNCLNSIREMILNNENEQASLYLSKFARLIRITLDHSSKTFISLEDTIDYLQRYLEMEQIRKSNFAYTIDVDDDLQRNEILLPPMLIQPFIENAIWHGSSPGKEMKLNIRFTRKKNELICIVEDDGIGIDISLKNKETQLNYQSVGISNIKQRIQVLNEKYNLQSTVDIKDKSGLHLNGDTGTIVTLHLTIKSKEALL